jgi:acetyl-CoA acetyltransferase
VEIPQRKGDPVVVSQDEGVRADTTVESLGRLRPAFSKDGTITAGSSSQISDGAAAVVVMSKAKAEELGLTWLAEIGAHGVVAGPDSTLQSQPSAAIAKACAKEGISPADLDLVEINEAFASVGIKSMRDLELTEDKVNVNGGAIALGHPIGMSGARIALHLALELQRRGGGVGAAAVVLMSMAMAVELGLTWMAEIGAHGFVAGPDSTLQTQPSQAIAKACAREGIAPTDLDLIEINEAFASVGIKSMRDLGVDEERVNVNGGAIALGHPVGMSGARITLHLALELKRRGGGIGAAALCGGGGQGDALIVRVPKA